MATRLHKPELRQKALELYFEGKPLKDIAREVGVPYGTLHGWHCTEKWPRIRRQMRADLLGNWREKTLNLAGITALQCLTKTMELCNSLAAAMERVLVEKGASLSLNDVSKMAAAVKKEYALVERMTGPILERLEAR